MNTKQFFFKLIPLRATFPHDITPEEESLMDEHAAYFRKHFDEGRLLLYGPVMAPDGAFGIGVLEVAGEADARAFGENDPSVRGGLNRFEIYPMFVSGARAKS